MKFLYVAPRFHPNQYPIIKGLIQKGHEVTFAVSRVGSTEKHDGVTVNVMQPSGITKLIYKYFKRKGENYAENKMILWFSPKAKDVKKLLKEYNPDVVIVRDRNLLSLKFVRVCRSLKIKKVLLYNQSPIYVEAKKRGLKDSIKILWQGLFPKKRITVCRYKEYPSDKKTYEKDENAYFLPFIVREQAQQLERTYSSDGVVRIFDCGKYRSYKNHTVLVEAAKKLVGHGVKNFFVTIVGQADNEEECQYLEALKNRISDYELGEYFHIETAVPYERMRELYLTNDVFVLTSKRELANVSILDAMSYGLAVIATTANGTSDYITPNENGYVFKTDDSDELSEKLKIYLNNPELVAEHGKNAFSCAASNHGFESYHESLMTVIDEI